MKKLPNDLKTGQTNIDSYLEAGFYAVKGMSSRFSASICSNLALFQTENKIEGDFIEIGTYKGRFFIPLSLCLNKNEQALGIDTFDWPDASVENIFHDACKEWGLKNYKAHKGNTAQLTKLLENNKKARIIHIDGDHSPEPLTHDLNLSLQALHPQGVIILDDMLHPCYPFLVTIVQKFLEKHQDFRLMAIIDRETINAAAKFILCHKESVNLYETYLMQRFKRRHYLLGGDALGYHCVVLTPKPSLSKV